MDIGLLFGFIATWVLVAWALMAGGEIGAFINVPSVILVFGASITVVFFSYPVKYAKNVLGVMKRVLFYQSPDYEKLISDLVSFAEIARRDGILSLENATKDIEDTFLTGGIQMAVDGTDPELIEQIMTTELENIVERHENGRVVFEAVGKYAPAYGMIGTLIGLIIMLKNMTDPSSIGSGMAVALLTTLYGAMIANGVALPVADRLTKRSSEEVLAKTIIIKGVMAIQSGDNPRIVEQKLRTFLPPDMRSTEAEEAA